LTTGFDADVRCIIDAQPTKSRIRFVQKIGRGLRTAGAKDRLIILDHAGNHLRLGRVTDIHQAHLDDGEKREGSERKERAEPLPKLCPECRAVLAYKARECSACGAQIISITEVDEVEGELVEFGSRKSGTRKTPAVGGILCRADVDPAEQGPSVGLVLAQVPRALQGRAPAEVV
jgi:DNA repair protein RadD